MAAEMSGVAHAALAAPVEPPMMLSTYIGLFNDLYSPGQIYFLY